MENKEIFFSIESKLENVSLLGKCVNGLASSLKFSVIESHNIELCVVEAINNIIEHGYKSLPGNIVNVTISVNSNKLIIIISDNGITNINKPKKELDYNPNDIPNLPERGFGMYLINRIMDSMEYESVSNTNYLTLIKNIS